MVSDLCEWLQLSAYTWVLSWTGKECIGCVRLWEFFVFIIKKVPDSIMQIRLHKLKYQIKILVIIGLYNFVQLYDIWMI